MPSSLLASWVSLKQSQSAKLHILDFCRQAEQQSFFEPGIRNMSLQITVLHERLRDHTLPLLQSFRWMITDIGMLSFI